MNTAAFTRRTLSRRVVLWAGFGGLLLLMLLIASMADRALRRVESTNTALRKEFLRRDHLLDMVRLRLFQSSVDVRDYLLEPHAPHADRRSRDLENTRQRMTDAVEQLRRQMPAAQTSTINELAFDLDQYWFELRPILSWDAATRAARGDEFLRAVVFPRHEQLLVLADHIAEIDDKQLEAGEENLTAVFRDFRNQLTVVALLLVGLGAMLAHVTINRILALEHTSKIRYDQVVLARADLQHLSARLVAAQEEERRRLSRELHDGVAQSMSAVLYELGNLQAQLPEDAAHLKDYIVHARQLAETSVGAVRNMALLLRPSMLDDLGLVPALKWQAREVSRRTGLKVKVTAGEMPEDLPDEYRTCIFRVVQESLHNCARHAHATTARVNVKEEDGAIDLRVEDDGLGFDTSHEKGMGLLGMEERVRSLSGEFHVDSTPGRGTTILVKLALTQANGDKQ